jgi:protein SCO1/2
VKPLPVAVKAREASPARAIPDLPLLDQTGAVVRFHRDVLRGRLAFLAFGYTRCAGSCPATALTMMRIGRLLRERAVSDAVLVTVTLDPENDTPDALAAHAGRISAGPGWRFLTGRAEHLEALRAHLGYRDPDPAVDADRSLHAARLTIGHEPSGRWAALPGSARAEEALSLGLRLRGDYAAARAVWRSPFVQRAG